MTSTFMGLEIGKRAVVAHQTAINTTGHNLSNRNTEGYSRQRVEFSPFEPIYLPGLNREETPGQLGQGAVVSRIERIRDQLLDRRIVAQAGGEGYWTARDPYIRNLENITKEVGANSVRPKLDEFWNAWQELSMYPADTAPRTAVVERANTLLGGIRDDFLQLRSLQDMADGDVKLTVDRINDLSKQIAGLNSEIQRIKAQGDNPNDLYDRRDLLVDRLSSLISVTVDTRDPDEFMVHTGGHVFVQGSIGRQFDLRRSNDEGFAQVFWADMGTPLEIPQGITDNEHTGKLGALLELRDHTIATEIQSLDTLAMNFIDLVNEVHRGAYGLNGSTGNDFFVERAFVTNVNGNYDRDGDGEYDTSYIFRINGVNELEARAQVGLSGTITLSAAGGTVDVPYYPTDTVADIITRMNNSGAEVTARLNRDGHLSFRGTPNEKRDPALDNPDFVIRHIEDSGRFLEGYAGVLNASGPDGAYDWAQSDAVAALRGDTTDIAVAPVAHPSGWIEVNPAILRDNNSVAAGFGENGRPANPGNGEAALAIASIRNTSVMVGKLRTFDDFFADAVARIGELGKESNKNLETQNLVMKELKEMRESVSGVNMDEELSDLLRYQQGYAAAARFITTVNSLLDTLINRMGV
ncbi:flagellar hook protein FlgK [Spirochaetia bacterium]|nr:flagellar hook protein FlgK [Spirochaetia bacterium]